MIQPITYFLELIPDHRRAQGLMYPKVPLLIMMIMANMSGCYGYREMAKYMENNLKDFDGMFELKHGVPKHVALGKFINKLDFSELLQAFQSWASQFVKIETGDVCSYDGKGLNSTVENCHSSEQKYKSMVSLYSHKMGLVVDTEMIEIKKSHEIQAAQKLIGRLEAKGIILIGDALHCQKKTQKSPEIVPITTS